MFTFEYAMRGEICKVQTVRLFSLTKFSGSHPKFWNFFP